MFQIYDIILFSGIFILFRRSLASSFFGPPWGCASAFVTHRPLFEADCVPVSLIPIPLVFSICALFFILSLLEMCVSRSTSIAPLIY